MEINNIPQLPELALEDMRIRAFSLALAISQGIADSVLVSWASSFEQYIKNGTK